MRLYHGLPKGQSPTDFTFLSPTEHPEGLHLGTLAQARMRSGGGTVLEVEIPCIDSFVRVKDRDGSWSSTIKRHMRNGAPGLVYLNRHEGITLETAIRLGDLGLHKASSLSDAAFRKHAPEAEDSYIVFDPSILKVTEIKISKSAL